MRNRFDEQLGVLNTELITMGALCEDAISMAVKYLTDDEESLKEKVNDAEKQIDRKERDIENLCMRLLLLQQPVARDLRKISSALKMISDMERAEQIFSYRDYPYMKKRWEKFCRHSPIAGTESLKWEEEMERFHHFLGDMWEAVCRDEVFFGDWMPELARFLG